MSHSEGMRVIRLPTWKLLSIGFAAMSVGMTLGLSPAYVAEFAGLGAALSQVIGTVAMVSITAAICVYARQFIVTGSLMSFAGRLFGVSGESVVGGSLLCGYLVMIPSTAAATQVFLIGALRDFGIEAGGVGMQAAAAVLVLTVAAALAWRGIEASARATAILGYACVIPLLIVLWGLVADRGIDFVTQTDVAEFSFTGVLKGAIVAMIFMTGFEGLSTLAAETHDPRKMLPRLLYTLVISTGVMAFLATMICAPHLVRGRAIMESGVSPVALLAEVAGLPGLKISLNALLVPCGMAALVAVINYAARIVATAGRDGLLPAALAHVHAPSQTARRAVVTLAVLGAMAMIAPAMVGGASPLVVGSYYASAVVYYWLIPYGLICLGAVVLERRSAAPRILVIIVAIVGATLMLLLALRSVIAPDAGIGMWMPIVVFGTSALMATWFLVRAHRRERAEDAC